MLEKQYIGKQKGLRAKPRSPLVWRRDRDSNPRSGLTDTRFPVVRPIQTLSNPVISTIPFNFLVIIHSIPYNSIITCPEMKNYGVITGN